MVEASGGNSFEPRFSIYGAYRALPADTEREFLRVAQEAIRNVEKHARATNLFVQLEYGRLRSRSKCAMTDVALLWTQSKTRHRNNMGRDIMCLTGMRERAAAIGGVLEVTSKPGSGTSVRLRVRMRLRTSPPGESREQTESQSDTGSIRVLVVEDHHVVRQGLVALLNVVDGLEVVGEAADGVEAISQFRKHLPAITLIDLRLPRLSGVEVIQRIRWRRHKPVSSC